MYYNILVIIMKSKGVTLPERKMIGNDLFELDSLEPKECTAKPCRTVILLRYPRIK